MDKLKTFLKKVLIVICVIAILATCVNVSVKYYRKVKMDELIAIVTDEDNEVDSSIYKDINTYLETSRKIDSYEEYFLTAFLDEKHNDFENAKDNYNKAIECSDDNSQIALAYRKIGIIDCNNGKYKEAIKSLEKSLEYESKNNNALLYLSESYLQQGNYSKALEYVNKYADNADLTYSQIEAILTMYISINEYQGVLRTINKAIKQYPEKEVDLVLYRLQANLLNDNYEAALEDARKYSSLTSKEVNDEIVVASYYNVLGMYDKALDIYLSHIENKEYDLLESAVECAYQIDNYETMLALSKQALNYYEDDEKIDYYKWQAIALMQLGHYKEAIASFDNYLEVNDSHFEVIYLRALCYFTLAEYQKAIDDFTKVIDGNSLVEDSLYNRALCYVQINDLENSKIDLEAVKDLNSGSETYLSAIELLNLFVEDYEVVSDAKKA